MSSPLPPYFPTFSDAYMAGIDFACRPHNWTHLFNSEIDRLLTMPEKVDFFNGYHDGIADKYRLPRPAHVSADSVTRFDLYLYP